MACVAIIYVVEHKKAKVSSRKRKSNDDRMQWLGRALDPLTNAHQLSGRSPFVQSDKKTDILAVLHNI